KHAVQQREQTERGVQMDPSYAALYEAPEEGLSMERAHDIEQRSWETTRLLVQEEEPLGLPEPGKTQNILSIPSVSNGIEDESKTTDLASDQKRMEDNETVIRFRTDFEQQKEQ